MSGSPNEFDPLEAGTQCLNIRLARFIAESGPSLSKALLQPPINQSLNVVRRDAHRGKHLCRELNKPGDLTICFLNLTLKVSGTDLGARSPIANGASRRAVETDCHFAPTFTVPNVTWVPTQISTI